MYQGESIRAIGPPTSAAEYCEGEDMPPRSCGLHRPMGAYDPTAIWESPIACIEGRAGDLLFMGYERIL